MTLVERTDVAVIGGGVIGLSTAVLLAEGGTPVEVLAADPPHETTSNVAAAIWYPYRAYPEDRVLRWGRRTLEVFEKLAGVAGTGARIREGLELFREPAPDPWWREAVPAVRRCERSELPPGYADGFAFAVPVVEMPLYLAYLLRRLRSAGGSFVRRRVSSLEEAAEGRRAVLDCSGLGARELAGDGSVFPIRGQVVRVRNPGLERFLLDEENPEGVTYVVPRSGDCVLGGTAEEGRWETEPDPRTAQDILRRCAALEPRLAGAEVLGHAVGLRPGRPEVRLETEEVSGAPVVHDYGHGGSGVTLSWGCAEESLRMLREALDGRA